LCYRNSGGISYNIKSSDAEHLYMLIASLPSSFEVIIRLPLTYWHTSPAGTGNLPGTRPYVISQ
jgi:hypothetical protein